VSRLDVSHERHRNESNLDSLWSDLRWSVWLRHSGMARPARSLLCALAGRIHGDRGPDREGLSRSDHSILARPFGYRCRVFGGVALFPIHQGRLAFIFFAESLVSKADYPYARTVWRTDRLLGSVRESSETTKSERLTNRVMEGLSALHALYVR